MNETKYFTIYKLQSERFGVTIADDVLGISTAPSDGALADNANFDTQRDCLSSVREYASAKGFYLQQLVEILPLDAPDCLTNLAN